MSLRKVFKVAAHLLHLQLASRNTWLSSLLTAYHFNSLHVGFVFQES